VVARPQRCGAVGQHRDHVVGWFTGVEESEQFVAQRTVGAADVR
jgi:hypothetical protein